MSVVGYARVSTILQADASNALDQQIDRLKSAGADTIYIDVESGRKSSRTNYRKLLEDVKTGGIQKIIITRLDRLGRSVPELRKAIALFQEFGVNLQALDDSIDTSSPAGKFHINIIGSLAEMESDRLSERITAGVNYRRKQQKPFQYVFGYTIQNEKYELDKVPFLCLLKTKEEISKSKLARELLELYLSEKTIRLSLRKFNLKYGITTASHRAKGALGFSIEGFSSWINNPTLRGHTTYFRRNNKKETIFIPDTHPEAKIISEDEWRRIQEQLKTNHITKGGGSARQTHPLSNLVFCADCQRSCHKVVNNYFQCKNWRTRQCFNKKMVDGKVIEEALIKELISVDFTINLAKTHFQPSKEQESAELKQLRQSLQQLELMPKNPALDQAIADLKMQIKSLETDSQRFKTSTDVKMFWNVLELYRSEQQYKDMSDEQKRNTYKTLVSKILIKDGRVMAIELKY